MQIKKTRFDGLGYTKIADGIWQHVDTNEGRNAAVGPQYPSEVTLAGDTDRYYQESWASPASTQHVVHILLGSDACSHWSEGKVTDEVKDNLNTLRFASRAEVDAFLSGVQMAMGYQDFDQVTDDEAVRIEEEPAVDPDAEEDESDEDEDSEDEGNGEATESSALVWTIGDTGFTSRWVGEFCISDRDGCLDHMDSHPHQVHDLMVDPDLHERLRSQMFEDMTFISRKDGQWGVLFELEIVSVESEEGKPHDPTLMSREFREAGIRQAIENLTPKYPAVQFASAHPDEVYETRNALWAFVADGALSRSEIHSLGTDLLDFAYGVSAEA